MKSFLFHLSLTVLSALFLVLAFPRYDLWIFAWFALVPFLWFVDRQKPLAAFGWGFFLGVLFFAGILYWIVHVTVLGLVLLVLYLAVYFGLFALGYRLLWERGMIEKVLVLPSWWVVLEFVRSRLFTGFGWGALGYSQYQNTVLIQIADITGVAGVSFLIVMANLLISKVLQKYGQPGSWRPLKVPVILGFIFLICALGYGTYRLATGPRMMAGDKATVAVIQGNIPQWMKWNEDYHDLIWEEHLALTEQAAEDRPDVIVWPESSFPGYLWESPQRLEALKEFTGRLGIPVLVGIVRQVGEDYYNSAFLISQAGEAVVEHDKLHLVPFGEYVPWRGILPFLTDIVPIDDFTPGRAYTLFPVDSKNHRLHGQKSFGVLICFEDTIPYLSREFVRTGADLLINITNDAWFGDTNEPFLHLQGSVFRAVENKRSVVRSANTGVSAFIDPFGRVYKTLEDERGKSTYISGYASAQVPFTNTQTFYTKFGEIFTYFCFGCILMIILKPLKIFRGGWHV